MPHDTPRGFGLKQANMLAYLRKFSQYVSKVQQLVQCDSANHISMLMDLAEFIYPETVALVMPRLSMSRKLSERPTCMRLRESGHFELDSTRSLVSDSTTQRLNDTMPLIVHDNGFATRNHRGPCLCLWIPFVCCL